MNHFKWKRIVVKVGSALIAPNRNGCSSRYLLAIAQFIQRCRLRGIEVVLVSSGSVAAGRHLFGEQQNDNIAIKKAMAAAGQNEMMATWDRFFDFKTAQILLTHADLRDRERYESVRETLFSLIQHGILPIVNENDTVTTDKLKVGDNDNLSAMVAAAADADCLIICSDVDGLYDKNPHKHDDAQRIAIVNEINDDIREMAGGATSAVGTGGMRTKIEAAEKATSHGISTFIINGHTDEPFQKLLAGENPGTLFTPYEKPMHEELHWLTHTSSAQGEVVVESTFDKELDAEHVELTSEDIVEVKGDFGVGDTILVRNEDGEQLVKAKSRFSSCLLNFIAEQDDDTELATPDGSIIAHDYVAQLSKQD